MLADLKREKNILEARDDVKRLGGLSIRIFQGQSHPKEPDFWVAVGKQTPLLDPWGQPYHMEVRALEGKNLLVWYSSGPDQISSTNDDITYSIPFGDSIIVELDPSSFRPPSGGYVNDAK